MLTARIDVSADARVEAPMRWLVVGLVAFSIYIVWPAAGAIALGGFTALIAWRPFRWLARKLGKHDVVASALATLVLSLIVLAPFVVTAVLVVREATIGFALLQRRPDSLDKMIAALPPFARSGAARYSHDAARLAALAGGYLLQGVGSLTSYVIEAFLAVVTLFYSLWRGPDFVAFVRRASPLRPQHTSALLDELHLVARGLFWGNVAIAVLHGVAGAIGYAIAGVPALFLLGCVTMFASFIPGIGTAVVWIPIAIVLWLVGHHWNALFLLAWGFIVIGGIDQLLRPVLARVGSRLPTVVMFVTIYGGLVTLGIKGLLLGPLFGALAISALRIFARSSSLSTPA